MKNKYFERKSHISLDNDFCLFAYFPISKANLDSELTRRINRQKLKRLILPSSFKIIKDQIVQGPRFGIVYSSSLNFKKLPTLFELQSIGFKLKQNWYAFNLLLDLKPYKSPIDLCLKHKIFLDNNSLKFCLYLSFFSQKN